MRFYHVDLPADLGTRRLTWRRLAVLLSHLPRESAYVQAVAGDTARWGDTEHLLAGVIDSIRVGNFYTAMAASNRRFKDPPSPPCPIPRPGDESARKRNAHGYSQDQVNDLLAKWRSGDLEMVDTAVEVT